MPTDLAGVVGSHTSLLKRLLPENIALKDAETVRAWFRTGGSAEVARYLALRGELARVEAIIRSMTPEERAEIAGFFPTEVWEEAGGNFPTWRRSYEIM